MNDTVFYLEEAAAYIELMDEPNPLAFFESEEEGISDPQEAAGWGAMKALKKAVQSIIQAVKDLIEKVVDFVKSLFMSKEDKERYNAFKEMVRNDPALANTKITIANWKVFEEAYDKALKEAEAAAKSSEYNATVADKIMEKLENKVRDLFAEVQRAGTAATMHVTVKTAAEIADQNALAAKGLKMALDAELVDLQNLEKELGEREIAKFKKRVDVAARNSWLHRMRVKIFKSKNNTLSKIVKNGWNKLLSFTNIKNGKLEKGTPIVDSKSVVRGISKNADTVAAAAGGADKAAAIAMDVAKSKMKAKQLERDVKKTVKKAAKDLNDLKDFMQ